MESLPSEERGATKFDVLTSNLSVLTCPNLSISLSAELHNFTNTAYPELHYVYLFNFEQGSLWSDEHG